MAEPSDQTEAPAKPDKPETVEATVRKIRRATRKKYSAEGKIRIVLEGLRGESGLVNGNLTMQKYYTQRLKIRS